MLSSVEEFAEILASPVKRLESIYSITTKSGDTVRFQPNDIQRIINNKTNKRKLILKARQFGVTTNEVIKMLDYCLWNYNRVACILAHEQDGIKKIFRIARFAHENLKPPFNMEVDRGGGSMYEMRFPTSNSKLYCDLESRGDTIHWLHVSEAAFVKDPNKVMATMQAVPLDGIITLESTANGMGNWFYDKWIDQTNDFEKIFCPWFFHGPYQIPTDPLAKTDEEIEFLATVKQKYNLTITDEQLAFRRAKQRDLKRMFRQEYPEDDQTCFLSSGNAAIDAEKIVKMKNESKKIIQETMGIKIYEKCNKLSRYVVGVDCAEGYDGDYSVASVFDVTKMEQVACFRGHVKPYELAHILNEISKIYAVSYGKLPTIGIERNNHGHAVLLEMHEHIKYPNLYSDKDDKLGWLTDRISRPLMLDTFIQAIENNKIKLNDETTLQECLTLIEVDGRIEAGTSKHDDTIIASAIALQLCIKESSALYYENIGKMIKI